MNTSLQTRWLGRIGYEEGLELQESLVREKIAGEANDTLLLLEHDPVYTLGKGADANHLLANEGELVERKIDLFAIDRGGDVTFHGPGQLVGYPILD